MAFTRLSNGRLVAGDLVNADVSASAAIDGSKIVAASASVPGVVTTGTQTFAGAKTFASSTTIGAQVTSSPTSPAHILSGALNSDSTGTGDAQRRIMLNVNGFDGSAWTHPRDSVSNTLGGVRLQLIARTTDTAGAFIVQMNQFADANGTSPDNVFEIAQSGVATIGQSAGLGTGAAAYHNVNGTIRANVTGSAGTFAGSARAELGANFYRDGAGTAKSITTGGLSLFQVTSQTVGTSTAFSFGTSTTSQSADGTALTDFANIGLASAAGQWTFGILANDLTHTFNGASLDINRAGAALVTFRNSGSQTASLQAPTGGGINFRGNSGTLLSGYDNNGAWTLGPTTGGANNQQSLYGTGNTVTAGFIQSNTAAAIISNQAYTNTDITNYTFLKLGKSRASASTAFAAIGVRNAATGSSSNSEMSFWIRNAADSGEVQAAIIANTGAWTLGPSAGLGAAGFHRVYGPTGAASPAVLVQKVIGSDASSNYYMQFDTNTATQGYIWNNASGNLEILTASDLSLKDNVRDADYGLEQVMALRPVTFDWKSGSAVDVRGFIAQEIREVLPRCVSEGPDGLLNLGKDEFIPILVAAMQQQQTLIESLKARIEALEGA